MKTLTHAEAEKELTISFDTLREKQFPIDFLEQYSHTFDHFQWQQVSKKQNLTEDFILKFAPYLDWYYISQYQRLSYNFIVSNLDKINKSIFKNRKLNKQTKECIRTIVKISS